MHVNGLPLFPSHGGVADNDKVQLWKFENSPPPQDHEVLSRTLSLMGRLTNGLNLTWDSPKIGYAFMH